LDGWEPTRAGGFTPLAATRFGAIVLTTGAETEAAMLPAPSATVLPKTSLDQRRDYRRSGARRVIRFRLFRTIL
jgi:hypothetical protein